MSSAVHTRNKRFSFVEKDISEVGNGSQYPMLVTLDQVAEIYYRVKDASFISGSFTASEFGDDVELKFSGITKPAELVTLITGGTYGAYSLRGYCAVSNDITPDKPLPNTDEPLFGTTYYYGSPGYFYDVAVRDIGSDEKSMWECGYDPKTNDKVGFYWDITPDLGGASVGNADHINNYRNGFSQTFSADNSTDSYTLYGIFGDLFGIEILSEASINIGNEVAFVDVTGSGNPLDAGNSLYLSVSFIGYLDSSIYISTNNSVSLVGSMTPSGTNLVMRLAGGVDISCPLYYDDGLFPKTGGTDFVIKADEWWKFARLNPPEAVWDSDTGLKLPEGFIPLNLNNPDALIFQPAL